jgi:uroporphyrinogen-III decarboxylase
VAGETPKELFANLFQKRTLSRPPFIPWVSTFAAKLEQIPVREMLSDATLLTRSLQNAQKLFGYDGIPIVFDPTFEAEACGCEVNWNDSGKLPEVATSPLGEGATVEDLDISEFERQERISVALDTASRISIIKGREIPLLGVVTGPITLTRLLGGDSVIARLEDHSVKQWNFWNYHKRLT